MSVLFVDIETDPTRHDVTLPRVSIVTTALDDGAPVIRASGEAADFIRDFIRAGGAIVGHNLPFDLTCLGIPPGRTYDTYIRDVLLGAASGRHADASSSLKKIAARFGIPMPKKDKSLTLSFGGHTVETISPEQRAYAMDDIIVTREVFKRQGGLTRVSPDEERQTALSYNIFQMARMGVHVDRDRVLQMKVRADVQVKMLRDRVLAHGLIVAAGPKSDPWAKERLSRKLVQARLKAAGVTKLPKRRATDTRDPSGLLAADGETLRGTGDPGLVVLADYLEATKWASLVKAFDTGTDTIRAWWRPLVASGRLSCGGPNLTQVPRVGGLRECLIPRDGNVLVVMDFSALEFRVWAATCERWLGYSEAAKMLRAGEDVHGVVAREIMAKVGGEFPRRRQQAKAMNYGLIGGMSIGRLADTLGCTRDEAAPLERAWRGVFWEFASYKNYVLRQKVGGGKCEVVLPSGRARVAFPTEILNVVIQGGGADVAKDCLRLAQQAALPVVALPHDEFIIDVPEPWAEEVGHEIVRCAEEAGRMHYPEVPWTGNEFQVVRAWPSKKA